MEDSAAETPNGNPQDTKQPQFEVEDGKIKDIQDFI
jgi:hypothetical protein